MARLSILNWLKRAVPVLLLLWIVGIVFPAEWPGRLSWRYSRVLGTIFYAGWVHELAHFILYTGLGLLLSWWLGRTRWKPGRRSPGAVFAMTVLLVAVAQEGLQLVALARSPGAAEMLDLAIDLAGAAVGALVYYLAKRRTTESQRARRT